MDIDSPGRADMPARFLPDLAVKALDRVLAGIDSAAGQLKLGNRCLLVGQKHLLPPQEHRVDAGSWPIGLVLSGLIPISPHFVLRLPQGAAGGMPDEPTEGKPMTLGLQIAWDDTVLPFQLDRSDIRGRVARLDGVLDRVLAQHDYPASIEALVAEVALLTALIGQTIKLRWKLSIQVRGDGPARLIATDYYAPQADGEPARIRAYASYDAERLDHDADPFTQIGKGYFAILIDQGQGMTPYQGITPIAGGSLRACAETYFAQSEQLPTRFELAFGESQLPGQSAGWRAGGVMLQHMPKASPSVQGGGSGEAGLLGAGDLLDGDDAEHWSRANMLLDTIEQLELVGPSVQPTELLVRLFHEETPRVFDPQSVNFGCTCSADKVRQSLSIYSAKDIAHMTTSEGIVTADCQFCGAHYEFDPATLGFEATKTDDGDN